MQFSDYQDRRNAPSPFMSTRERSTSSAGEGDRCGCPAATHRRRSRELEQGSGCSRCDRERALRNQGYLEAKYKVTRDLKEDGTVDINAEYTRGNRSVFGKLKLSGLNPPRKSIGKAALDTLAGSANE